MNQTLSTIVSALAQLLVFAIAALVVSTLLARRLTKTKTGRELASKLVMLGLLSAFVLLYLFPRLGHQ